MMVPLRTAKCPAGLEDEIDRAIEPALVGETLGAPQKHRRVAVVATAVKDAVVDGAVRKVVGFLDG
jgi:hypothetical protein